MHYAPFEFLDHSRRLIGTHTVAPGKDLLRLLDQSVTPNVDARCTHAPPSLSDVSPAEVTVIFVFPAKGRIDFTAELRKLFQLLVDIYYIRFNWMSSMSSVIPSIRMEEKEPTIG